MNKEIISIYCNAYLDLVENAKLIDAVKYSFEKTNSEMSKKNIETFKKHYYRYRVSQKMPLLYKKS